MPIDVQKLIGEIAARNRCRVEDGDPIFAVSTINRLMLDEFVERFMGRIRVAIKEFETSACAVETHAGKVLAEEMRMSVSEWKTEIARDIDIANARSCEMIDKIHKANSRPAMIRWGAVGFLAAMVFVACGILIGKYAR